MATYPDLDALIRDARRSEDPSPHDRALVRRAVAGRIAGGLSIAAAPSSVAVTPDVAPAPAMARGERATRRAVQRASMSTGLLPTLALSVLCVLSADVSEHERAADVELVAATPGAPSPAEMNPSAHPSARVSITAPASVPSTSGAATDPVPSREAAREPSVHLEPRHTTASGNLAAESRALATVQRALRDGKAESALRLLDEQDRTFARGVLAEERAAARVLAWCSTGKTREAERARASFAARYPSSPLLARVAGGCAASPGR